MALQLVVLMVGRRVGKMAKKKGDQKAAKSVDLMDSWMGNWMVYLLVR